MITNTDLKRRFVLAVDEVLPPAPALEARVRDALIEGSPRRRPLFGPRLRYAAALVALLVVVAVGAALLYGPQLNDRFSPAHRSSPVGYVFKPASLTREDGWPAGGPVPAAMSGCWQSQAHPNDPLYELCLGRYSFDIGQGSTRGEVVVSGAEVVFFTAICNTNQSLPGDRYLYSVSATTLVLTSRSKSIPQGFSLVDQSNCGWELDGSYTRLPSS